MRTKKGAPINHEMPGSVAPLLNVSVDGLVAPQ